MATIMVSSVGLNIKLGHVNVVRRYCLHVGRMHFWVGGEQGSRKRNRKGQRRAIATRMPMARG
jgi:hypothetical protein